MKTCLRSAARRIEMTVVLVALGFAMGSAGLGAQVPAADIQKVENLLRDSRYTYTRVSHPTVAVWTIARQGEQIGSFRLIVTTEKGIVVAFVTVATKKTFHRTAELSEKLLEINHDLDYVKVGYDEDDDIFVRIDANLRILDVDEMNAILTQVGNVADATYVALKPFLVR